MGTYYDIHGVVLSGSRVGTATSSLDVGANSASGFHSAMSLFGKATPFTNGFSTAITAGANHYNFTQPQGNIV